MQDFDVELLKCSIDVIDAPDDPYIPILVAFAILFTVPVLTTAIYKSRAVRRGLVWICVTYVFLYCYYISDTPVALTPIPLCWTYGMDQEK